MKFNCIISIFLFVAGVFAYQPAEAQETVFAEGMESTVIHHFPSKTQKYVGCPSICKLPNWDYLASHSEFGKGTTEFRSGQTHIYTSSDEGKTWKKISRIDGQFWSNLFVHDGCVYIMGTNKHHGNFIIRKSEDNGVTWTIPYNDKTGLIAEGEYHTAPVPVLYYKGRIWRAVEYATSKVTVWGERYSPMVVSASVKSDLLDRKSWRISNRLPWDGTYLDGNFRAWIEGNVVLTRDGELVDYLRVNTAKPDKEFAAIAKIGKNGRSLSFDPSDGFVEMPGGAKKFTIRYDEATDRYITLASMDDGSHPELNPSGIRNRLVLMSSYDLKKWDVHETLIYNEEVRHHGFQYVDWMIDGNDLIFVCRTSDDEENGQAKNNHDANYLTFHRIKDYKQHLK